MARKVTSPAVTTFIGVIALATLMMALIQVGGFGIVTLASLPLIYVAPDRNWDEND